MPQAIALHEEDHLILSVLFSVYGVHEEGIAHQIVHRLRIHMERQVDVDVIIMVFDLHQSQAVQLLHELGEVGGDHANAWAKHVPLMPSSRLVRFRIVRCEMDASHVVVERARKWVRPSLVWHVIGMVTHHIC